MEVGGITGEQFQQAENTGSYLLCWMQRLWTVACRMFPLLCCLSTPVVIMRHMSCISLLAACSPQPAETTRMWKN